MTVAQLIVFFVLIPHRSTELDLSSVLPCGMHLCAAVVLNFEKPRLWTLLSHGQQGPVLTAASLGRASLKASVALLPLCPTRAVFGSSWSTRPEGKGTPRWGRGFKYRGSEYGIALPLKLIKMGVLQQQQSLPWSVPPLFLQRAKRTA